MRRALWVLAIVLGCTEDTQALDASLLPPITDRGDARPDDADAFVGIDLPVTGQCERADDCAWLGYPICTDGTCRCGTYATCLGGQCLAFSSDGCVDGGVGTPDAGAGCTVVFDCDGPPLGGRCGPGSAWTCLENECVWECGQGGRTCDVMPPCMVCLAGMGGSAERFCDGSDFCSFEESTTMRVEASTCGEYVVDERFEVITPAGSCEPFVDLGFGYRRVFLMGDSYVAELRNGYCIGHELPTGLRRIAWSCPGGCVMVWVQ